MRKLTNISIAICALGMGAFVGCGGGATEATPAPTPEATPAPTPEPTPEATPAPAGQMSESLKAYLATISEADKARVNPKAGDAAAIEAGKTEFQSTCLPCHGASGKGDGPAAVALNPKPADLTDAALNSQITSGQRFAIMKNGIPNTGMQPFGAALSDDKVWELIAYVESLVAAPAAAAPPAEGAAAPAPATH
jgi:mono/diheme cytochrome c family protein